MHTPVNRVAWVVVVLGGLIALSSILASVFGAHAILLAVGSTIFTIVVAWMAGPQQRMRQERLERQRQAQLERQRQAQLGLQRREQQERQRRLQLAFRTLDSDCADLLRRAEAAKESILVSDARAQNLLDLPVNEELLRDNVQAVLNAGRKITNLRAKQRAIISNSSPKPEQVDLAGSFDLGDIFGGVFGRPNRRGGVSDRRAEPDEGTLGPLTRDVIGRQQEALAIVLRSVKARVENLEHYASSVKTVDRTYRDWIGSQEAERLNDPVRDVLAETVRDELAVEELKMLTERAATAEQAFRLSIHEANLAGETLALPEGKNP